MGPVVDFDADANYRKDHNLFGSLSQEELPLWVLSGFHVNLREYHPSIFLFFDFWPRDQHRSVVTWGDARFGGESLALQEQLQDIRKISRLKRRFFEAEGQPDRAEKRIAGDAASV